MLLLALLTLVSARPCLPSSHMDTMDVSSARRVLGVEGVASAEQTRASFHKASLRAHPDKPGGSHEEFVKVTEAYEVLRNGVDRGSASGYTWSDSRRGGGHDRRETSGYDRRFGSPPTTSYDGDYGEKGSGGHAARNRDCSFENFERSRSNWGPRDGDTRAGYAYGGYSDGTQSHKREPTQKWWDGSGGKKTKSKSSLGNHGRVSSFDRRSGGTGYDETNYPYDGSPEWHDHGGVDSDSNGNTDNKWWSSRNGDTHDAPRFNGFGPGADGGFGTFGMSRIGPLSYKSRNTHASRDDLESMEEYVWRRAWADSRGVGGHERILESGEFVNDEFNSDSDDGWDDARARALIGEES